MKKKIFSFTLTLTLFLVGALPAQAENVTITSGSAGNVYGNSSDNSGMAANADPNSNILDISGGTVAGNAFGGWSELGNASYNEINITTATVSGIVFGAWVNGGNSNKLIENSVFVITGAVLRGNLYGAYSQGNNGILSNNSVLIDGGSVTTSNSIIAGAYSAIGLNTISGNSVTLNSGTINNANIYGGRGQAGSPITGNWVTINGGSVGFGSGSATTSIYGGQSVNGVGPITWNTVTITGGNIKATIYGGSSGGKGNVTNNTVSIAGNAAVTGNIYGGYSTSGTATDNTVTIGDTATLQNSNLFGGQVGSGGGDAFTGNTLNKDNDAAIISATNFQFVNFGYTGDANIDILNTTPTGSAQPGVTLDTDAYNINFGGIIAGTGNLTKIGTGTLTLTGGNTYTGGTTVNTGSLQIGNGGLTGSIIGNIIDNANVTFNRSNTLIYSGVISGSGSLTKLGGDTLVLTNANTYSGGTTVSAGTLQLGNGGTTGSITGNITDNAVVAFNHADDVTFSGTISGSGKVIQRGAGTLTLQNSANSFTGGTEIGSGTLNIVGYPSSFNNTSLTNFMAGAYTAGYITFTGADTVGQEKTATVNAVGLMANSFRTQTGAGKNNRVDLTNAAIWYGNDYVMMIANIINASPGGAFYVESGTSMSVDAGNNLLLALNVVLSPALEMNDLYVNSNGIFNMNLKSAIVTFASGIDGEGTLNISGDGAVRLQSMVAPSYPQTFHMGTTNVYGSKQTSFTLLRPSGADRVLFTNTDSFNLTGDGSSPVSAMLMGDGMISAGNTITVNRGALAPTSYLNPYTPIPGTLTLNAPTINLNDFALLYMAYGPQTVLSTADTTGIQDSNNTLLYLKGTVNLGKGNVYFVTDGSSPFAGGPLLVIRSDSGFAGVNNSGDLNSRLKAYVDGFSINTDSNSPRSSGDYSFQLGGDPDGSTDVPGGTTNAWFMYSYNSLTMDWAGSITRTDHSGSWENGPFFYSLQTGTGDKHELFFMTGDKVYISGNDNFIINLPPTTLTSKIVVSGLVVGKDASGIDQYNGNYAISGAGGISANVNTAFGMYVGGSLIPTGMLQKYGGSTLTFTNTGRNYFDEGIELYGGTIAFNQGNQLLVGTGEAITFKGNATLRSNADVILDLSQNIAIEPGILGSFDTNGHTARIEGTISGGGSLVKASAGTLILTGTNTYSGGTTVSTGVLQIGDGGTTGSIASDIIVTKNANVTFNRSNPYIFNETISGQGSVTKDGAGTLTLTRANTYEGLTTVLEGTLALSGSGRISDTLALYGGTTLDTGGLDVGYITSLDVLGRANWTGDLNMKVDTVTKTMSFHVPNIMETVGTGLTMLKVAGDADITASTVNMHFTIPSSSSLLQVGHTISLIQSAGLTGYPANDTVWGKQGVSLQYKFELITTGTALLATLTGVGSNEQSKALSEGYLNGLALLNQGGDLVAGQGMAQAMRAANENRDNGWGTFGILSGGWSRYNTGSHMDLSSVSLLTGLAWAGDLVPGHLTFGAFFEYGNGSYDTYNSFTTAAAVHGKGTLYHLGGGILGRMDFTDTGSGHTYTEASLRAGNLHNDYHADDLRDSFGRRAEYTSNSAYYGIHLAAGYIWKINDKDSLDLYGKYFWTRQQGDSVTLPTGDPVKFEDADSHRLRIGGRFTRAASKTVSPYIGIAWEREFDGTARATSYGYDIIAPSLRGNTGIGEIGLTMKPREKLPLTIDVGMQGYIGERKGATGQLHIRYSF